MVIEDYEYEIGRALKDHPERHLLSLRITGDEGATKLLSVTPAQVRAIRSLLAEWPR